MKDYALQYKNSAIGLTALLGFLLQTSAFAAAPLDDATIFAIFDQANTAEISTGQLGAQKGKSDEVRALGKMVQTDHQAVRQMGRDLAKKLGVTPTPPANDKSAEALANTMAMLQSKSGAEFDKTYLQHGIATHQGVIDAIKGTLLPAAKHPELKKLINDVLPGFTHHLEAAKAAAKKLNVAER